MLYIYFKKIHNIYITRTFTVLCASQMLKDFAGNNVFVDMSTSKSRRVESAVEVTTCVTPSHPIYSTQLCRYLKPVEFLAAQAVFRCDAGNKDAFDSLVKSGKAQDYAGNGMTGTVVQASFLTSLVCCNTWREMRMQAATPQPRSKCSRAGSCHGKSVNRRKLTANEPVPDGKPMQSLAVCTAESMPSSKVETVVARGSKRTADGQICKRNSPVAPRRRLYGKQSLVKWEQQKRRKGQGPGNKHGKGKKPMVSIWDKEQIFMAWEEAKEAGNPNPIRAVAERKMNGYFPGCLYPSKWGKVRHDQHWPLLVKTAPQLCKRRKELPNSLRSILQINELKYGSGTSAEKRSHLPPPLEEAIESMLVERIGLGEEVTMHFVKSTILFATSIWNECIGEVRKLVRDHGLKLLERDDAKLAQMSPDELDQHLEPFFEEADKLLQPILMTDKDGAVLKLVLCRRTLCKPNLCVYIYKVIIHNITLVPVIFCPCYLCSKCSLDAATPVNI